MKKKFKFPVLIVRQEENPPIGAHLVFPKHEPIFCFKDDDDLRDGRYVHWRQRCHTERKYNQRPVSAKERAESTLMNPSDGKQPQ